MNAGQELNALIAERILGWKRLITPEQLEKLKTQATNTPHWDFLMNTSGAWTDGETVYPTLPSYSEDLLSAWRLYESLRSQGLYVNVISSPKEHRVIINRIGKTQLESEILGSGKSDSLPHALCLAALQMAAYEPETPKEVKPKTDFLESLKMKFLSFKE